VILGRVWHVHEQAHQLVAVFFALVLPVAADHLSFRGDRVELLPEFQDRLADEFVRDRTAVVKP
jgi:hypothetical protein